MNELFALAVLRAMKKKLFLLFFLTICLATTKNSVVSKNIISDLPSTCSCSPDFAGPDQIFCSFPSSIGVKIGCSAVLSDPACAGICYTWQPANGLNMADRSNPNPTVSPTTTTTYTAHVIDKFSGDDLGNFQVTVFVVYFDMTIYKPKVIAGNTTTPATNQDIGAQTFENLDNDDNDRFFDNAPTEMMVAGGDDELVKLEISLKSSPWSSSEIVQIRESTGSTDVLAWLDDLKSSQYILGSDLTLSSSVSGAVLKRTIWLEGLNGTTKDKLEFELYYKGIKAPCRKAFLTILGVEKMTWKGNEGNSINNDNNILDDDPNLAGGNAPVGWPRGVRIFPDARVGNYKTPKRKATLEIELSTKPIESIDLYVKSFDIDDPLNEPPPPGTPSLGADLDPSTFGFVDPNDKDITSAPGYYDGTFGTASYTKDEDNRTSFSKTGVLHGAGPNVNPNGILAVPFNSSSKKAIITLEDLSLNPGDNYRLAINGDKDFLQNLKNEDNLDKYAIVDKWVLGAKGGYPNQVQKPSQYLSLILTVWRFLYLEFDSMENFNDNDDRFSRNTGFSDFDGPAGPTTPANIRSSTDITTLSSTSLTIPRFTDWKPGKTTQLSIDLSPYLGSIICLGNGRFEDGQMVMNSLPSPITSNVLGNGQSFINIDHLNISNIKCTLRPSSSGAAAGTPAVSATLIRVLKDISTNNFTWELLPTSFVLPTGTTLNDYDGIKIEPFLYFHNITSTNLVSASVVTNDIIIPTRLFDDDKRSSSNRLPYTQNIDATNISFSRVCILAQQLAETTPNLIHSVDIPFDANQESDPTKPNAEIDWIRDNKNYIFQNQYEMLSAGAPNPYFWAAYVCSAWQHSTDLDGDPEPNTCESNTTLGYTYDGSTSNSILDRVSDLQIVKGSNMTFIYREGLIDAGINKESLTVAHEIGHQFGLDHGLNGATGHIPEYPNNMGIMTLKGDDIHFVPRIIPRHQNFIRSRTNPPGY